MDFISQIIANSIIAASVYTLIAVGFNLIYGAVRFFNLAHGAMTAVGAYTVFFLVHQAGQPAWLSICAGVLVAGSVGWLLDRFVYRPLRNRGASQLTLLIASLGTFTALQAVVAVIFTSKFQILSRGGAVPETFTIAGAVVTQTQLFIFISACAVLAGTLIFLRYTRFGKIVRAVSDDADAAKVLGINTDAVIGAVFFVGSAFAGLAGILVGYDTAIEPTMGLALLLKGVIAAIVGGIGSVGGAAVGAVLLGFVENFGIVYLSGEWKDAVAFALLLLFLLFRPGGIMKS